MNEVLDQCFNCGGHGKYVKVTIHLYVRSGDLNNPKHTWQARRKPGRKEKRVWLMSNHHRKGSFECHHKLT
jgi:hypothetical protein